MSHPKAILLIHGSGHVPEHYAKLASSLSSKGIKVINERLPTNHPAIPPTKTLADDIAFIQSIVAKEVASGTHLTVLAHSYGGVVASDALGEFTLSSASGNDGGVTNIIYMASFIPAENESLSGCMGGSLPPYLVPQDDGTFTWDDPRTHLYSDLSDEGAKWAEDLRVNQAWSTQTAPLTCETAAWKVIPVSYVICEEDQALPEFAQEMMIGKVKAEGLGVREFRVMASHSPFLSMPDRIADIAVEVMNGA